MEKFLFQKDKKIMSILTSLKTDSMLPVSLPVLAILANTDLDTLLVHCKSDKSVSLEKIETTWFVSDIEIRPESPDIFTMESENMRWAPL